MPWGRAIGVACAAVAVCGGLRWALHPVLQQQGLYLPFIFAVLASSYVTGSRAGMLSAALSAAVVVGFFEPPGTTFQHATLLTVFLCESAAVILLTRELKRARDHAQAAVQAQTEAREAAEAANRAKDQFVMSGARPSTPSPAGSRRSNSVRRIPGFWPVPCRACGMPWRCRNGC
jgi:K+-sensing histidine kinase KdpD